jgi:hypothetical protein
MVRYYFDVQDGDSLVVDDEGTDLLDIADGQIEAAAMLADMAGDLAMRVPNPSGHAMSIAVRDKDGPLFSISFTFSRRIQ